ncbi:hypothetical protein [Ilumatobacter fluminis]|uniref:hypothetical protein n=1 Tax=Ilumatobacter fluminis TaxID=467091 RepID=UPI0032F01FC2
MYDELTRGVNPFSFIETMGVADATDDPAHIAALMDRFGIVKVRGLYDTERSRELAATIADFSGLAPDDFHKVLSRELEWANGGHPTLNDERFWPFAGDDRLRTIVTAMIGDDMVECGSAISAHFTARPLHRDRRPMVDNPDSPYWTKRPTKRIIRILHYCGTSGGSLGYIPFTHDERMFAERAAHVGFDHDPAWFERHRDVLTTARRERDFTQADQIDRHVCWAHADPGDVIMNTAGIMHCGEFLTGPRYFFVSTYAPADEPHMNITLKQRGAARFRDYHGYMAAHGFAGSARVLDRLADDV